MQKCVHECNECNVEYVCIDGIGHLYNGGQFCGHCLSELEGYYEEAA